MKVVFFVFILSSLVCAGQRPESAAAFQKSIPGDLGKPLRLPDPGYNPDFSLDDIADYHLKQRVFVIPPDSMYRKIFRRYHYTKDSLQPFIKGNDSSWYNFMLQYLADSIPAIDFDRQELVLYAACGQCLANFEHDRNESCHRNAYHFMNAWFLRDKKYRAEKETGIKRVFLDALYGCPPDNSSTPVRLPSLWNSDLGKFFEIGRKSSYLYTVQDDTLYKLIFSGYYHYASAPMPVIDFSKQELLVRIACHQCLASCTAGKEWDNIPCHRNACRYNDTWYIREK